MEDKTPARKVQEQTLYFVSYNSKSLPIVGMTIVGVLLCIADEPIPKVGTKTSRLRTLIHHSYEKMQKELFSKMPSSKGSDLDMSHTI